LHEKQFPKEVNLMPENKTIVPNDKNLSLDAYGLLSTMLNVPERARGVQSGLDEKGKRENSQPAS
jgi:hypothetical protein